MSNVDFHGLKQCLAGYDEGLRNVHCGYRHGDWQISDGAYDCQWSLRYQGDECVCCMKDHWDSYGTIENCGLSAEDFAKIYSTVCNTYGKHFLDLETVYQIPELSRMVNLSEALSSENQVKWEKKSGISIEDDLKLQQFAKKVKKFGIAVERLDWMDSSDGFHVSFEIVTEDSKGESKNFIFNIETDGTLSSIEKSLYHCYNNNFKEENLPNSFFKDAVFFHNTKRLLKKACDLSKKFFRDEDYSR